MAQAEGRRAAGIAQVTGLSSAEASTPGAVSIARAISKLGAASRSEGERLVEAGRVRVNGTVVRDTGLRVRPGHDRIEIDDAPIVEAERVYVALNKPRGLVTTRRDPRGRATIYECLADASLPFLGPVGRLDKASEGLLLLTNDSRWSARLLDPDSHVEKTYHVQVRGTDLHSIIERIGAGIIERETKEELSVKRVSLLRTGSRSTAWFEITLDEGKNRHLRRVFAHLDLEVTRLMRVSIGSLSLGTLVKGAWRFLSDEEVRALSR